MCVVRQGQMELLLVLCALTHYPGGSVLAPLGAPAAANNPRRDKSMGRSGG